MYSKITVAYSTAYFQLEMLKSTELWVNSFFLCTPLKLTCLMTLLMCSILSWLLMSLLACTWVCTQVCIANMLWSPTAWYKFIHDFTCTIWAVIICEYSLGLVVSSCKSLILLVMMLCAENIVMSLEIST